MADRTTEFGPDHPDTLSARGSVVRHRRAAGDLPGAIADAQVLVEDMTRALGPDHRDTHEQRRFLTCFLSANGETAEAVRRLTALFADVEALGPTRQSDLLIVRTSLARELERNGDLTGALAPVEREIAAERSTIYGIDENLGQHPLHRLEGWRDQLAAGVRRK
ncbi:hypothetical protein [Streptomyces tirandamycinicus]|uniref:Tetratricopeptide repeat protein n=1 Tax=Streptomyces tirandamycinicus TaxID=2174846 RepID=A0A2S1SPW3_9ACTN|nr:hypothetical protein [Streptomyces tirandamycinicus]AWI28448.1 hypothetical protein DDW44_06325 [Streptomyces tirandamycinicus]